MCLAPCSRFWTCLIVERIAMSGCWMSHVEFKYESVTNCSIVYAGVLIDCSFSAGVRTPMGYLL